MELTDKPKVCRLCLKNCTSDFEFVDEIMQYNLNSLQLYLDFEITDEPGICESCSDNIRVCLSFKSRCVLSEEHINSLMDSENNLKRDLRELYKNVMKIDDLNASSNSNVCRLCLEVVKCGAFVALENYHAEGLQKYFPELDVDLMYLPVTCIPCHKSLSHHLDFITSCLQTEERIIQYNNVEGTDSKRHIDLNNVLKFKSKNMLKNENKTYHVRTNEMYTCSEENLNVNYEMKTGNVDINSELDSKLEDEINFKMELLEDDNYSLHSQNPICVSKDLYKCTECPYSYKIRYNVKRHMLRHKNISEVATYNCIICTFQTKYKSYLHSHMLVHKTNAEVRMYNCADCAFKTKYRRCLNKHMLSHRTNSEVQMYKCVKCTFESTHQNGLNSHMLIHKSSETSLAVPLARCMLCNYKTKRKSNLRRHMRIHKNTEISTYKYAICGLNMEHKTSFDDHLSRHTKGETDDRKGVPDNVQECYFVDVANLEASSEDEKSFVKTCPDSD